MTTESKHPRYIKQHRVEFYETDMAGIVHFSNFYRWMEVCESDFFRSIGQNLANKKVNGKAKGWPRVSASCTFKAPVYYQDVVDIRLFIQRIGVKSLTMTFEFVQGETLLATGQLKTAYCEFKDEGGHNSLKSIEIPKDLVELIQGDS
jgi:acyl-CoA thioester hydrolase